MSKAIFLAAVKDANAVLPPFQADSGTQLYYFDNGVLKGGFVCISFCGKDIQTVLVMVDASEDTLDAMAASEDYAFVENVAEVEVQGSGGAGEQGSKAAERKPEKCKQDKNKIKAFLKAKGRKSKDVDDALTGVSAGAIRQGLCTLHKLSLAQYAGAAVG